MAFMRILIIEDDDKSRFALQSVLQERGYEVIAAMTAEEAALVEGHPFSAAVIDLRLPAKQGHTYAQELRAAHPNLRIIFVTAYHGDGNLQLVLPGYVLLIKPIVMYLLC